MKSPGCSPPLLKSISRTQISYISFNSHILFIRSSFNIEFEFNLPIGVVHCGMPGTINIYHLRRPLALETILLLLTLAQPFVTQAQSKSSKWKNAEDSLVVIHSHLSRWHPNVGIHLSSDAELYYAGASFQAGLDFNLTKRVAFNTYIHYFHANANRTDNTGSTEKGRFRTFTSAFLVQIHAGPGWYGGFFVGGGVALQQWADRFKDNFVSYDDARTTITPAIRIGYIFPAGLHAIAIEFNGTGPYSYSDGTYATVTETFTQVSLGVRFIF